MEYQRRLADGRLQQLLADFPAVMISGPRAAGKTTTARQVAAETVSLDSPADSAAFKADPDDALRGRREPLLLDEWQEVPEVLGAVRRAVDSDPHPGRFIVTGSVRGELENRVWPGTGRFIRMSMYGLTEVEMQTTLDKQSVGFLDKVASSDVSAFARGQSRPRLRDYLELATRGGFPEVALRPLSQAARSTWLESYISQVITRDAIAVMPRGDPQKMRAYFEALALQTAGTPLDKTLIDAAGIGKDAAAGYEGLFENLFLTERLPGWSKKAFSRFTELPKRYIVDPALAANSAHVGLQGILGDSDLLGRTLDTFITAQLRPLWSLSAPRVKPYHLRTKGGRQEIDLLLETEDKKVLAFEFKASSAPSAHDARHLLWLRSLLEDQLVAGAVMHTGPDVFRLSDRVLALPISTIWGA